MEELRSKIINIRNDLIPSTKKPNWKLYVEKENDSISKIYTGYYPNSKPWNWMRDDEPKWHPVDPFVFEGTIKESSSYRGRSAAGMSFSINGMNDVEMHINKIITLLDFIRNGKIKVTKQGFHGLWTFHKGGQNVFLKPWSES